MDMCCYKKCCTTNTTWSSSCLQIKHHTLYMIQQSKIKPQHWQEQVKFSAASPLSHYKIHACLVRIYKTTLTIASKSYLHPITFHASHETQGCIGYCMHFFPELKSCEHRFSTKKGQAASLYPHNT
jgi:hypothetical protein